MGTLEDIKSELLEGFVARRSIGWSVHGATFKSPFAIENADRMVVQGATICGQSWVLLAVLDGHSGPVTANYVSQRLPKYLRDGLRRTIETQLQGAVDYSDLIENASVISKMLQVEIQNLDDHIYLAVKRLLDNLDSELTERQALRLIDTHEEIIERAFQATSVALALINVDQHLMWTAGLGTSTVALSVRSDDVGIRRVERFSRSDDHPRPPGSLPVDLQVLGYSHLKHDDARLRRLFGFLSRSEADGTALEDQAPVNGFSTPPSVGNEVVVKFVDYAPLWARFPLLILFTHGVDQLVNDSEGHGNTGGATHNMVDSLQVVSHLLSMSDKAKLIVEGVLGHEVEFYWSPGEANRAVDILGNLLGGTDAEQLQRVVVDCRSSSRPENRVFDYDDTTVLLCDLTLLREQLEHMQGR